ncbi:MAG: hypothetical protein HY314_08805 [Acidobacteria bacterium]|nr:hypothetical protein [Acidobacteriota bacterium]
MDKTTTCEATPQVDAEYEAAFDQYMAEMKRLAEQMANKQRTIDRLQAETQAALEAVLAERKAA